MKFSLILIFIFTFSSVTFAECRMGIISIFNDNNVVDITNHLSNSVLVGKECSEKLGFEATSESYCNCLKSNPNTNYTTSRKKFRQKLGRQFKGNVFKMLTSLKQFDNYFPNQEFDFQCNLNKIIKDSCDDTMVEEMLPEYKGKNLAREIFNDHDELYNPDESLTMKLFKTNSCSSPLLKSSTYNYDDVKDPQATLNSMCTNFTNEVKNFCNNESLTVSAFDTFEFDYVSTPEVADNYNYYCKLIDKPRVKVNASNDIDVLKEDYERAASLEEVPAVCLKVCDDKAPYSIRGCKLNHEKSKKLLIDLNCKGTQAPEDRDSCNYIVEMLGNDVYYKIKNGSFNESDLEYMKNNLSEEDYHKVLELAQYNQVKTDVFKSKSVIEQFISDDSNKEEVAQQAPVEKPNAGSNSESPKVVQNQPVAQETPQAQQQPQQVTEGPQQNLAANNSGRLTMGARGRSRGNVSARTKQMVETIKTLREAGSSLKDAIAAQDRRMKREREKLAKANRDKYQRYDAETLEPLTRSPATELGSRSRNNNQLTNVGSMPSSGSGSGYGPSGGSGGSGGTGSSTFLPPEKKATVVDITGRSAPQLDLNNLQSSGATLPASITNHPDASEISKMFNGLNYEKGNERGPASSDDSIKKIKVDWAANSIDLGSLLINAKDLKPGEEFIVYKGDMDKFVRLVPAHTWRHGKKVFIGYRIENRNSENADLAASLFAKKFLIL